MNFTDEEEAIMNAAYHLVERGEMDVATELMEMFGLGHRQCCGCLRPAFFGEDSTVKWGSCTWCGVYNEGTPADGTFKEGEEWLEQRGFWV